MKHYLSVYIKFTGHQQNMHSIIHNTFMQFVYIICKFTCDGDQIKEVFMYSECGILLSFSMN